MGEAHFKLDESFKRMLFRNNRGELSRYRNDIIDELKSRGELGQDFSSPSEQLSFGKDRLFAFAMIIGASIVIGGIIYHIVFVSIKNGYDFEEAVCVIAILSIVWFVCQYLKTIFGRRIVDSAKRVSGLADTNKSEQRLALAKDSTEILNEKKCLLDEKLNL